MITTVNSTAVSWTKHKSTVIEEIVTAVTEPMKRTALWYGVFVYAGFRKEMRGIVTKVLNKISDTE